MFIELTDHLRCPRDHEEAYLVLLPDVVEQRDVRSGRLGCPVCQWETSFTDGVVDFGGGRAATRPSALTGEAVRAFLGVSGPGGYVALVGTPARLAPELAQAFRGVALVLVNPPEETVAEPPSSVLLAARIPLKSASMRGIVVGADFGSDPVWVEEALGSVLGGLRIVVEGTVPDLPGLEVLAEADGVYVGKKGS